MNIYLNINDVKDSFKNINVYDNIRYLYPKKNTIMEGEFTKILYSKEYVTLNGLYLCFTLAIPFFTYSLISTLLFSSSLSVYSYNEIWRHI